MRRDKVMMLYRLSTVFLSSHQLHIQHIRKINYRSKLWTSLHHIRYFLLCRYFATKSNQINLIAISSVCLSAQRAIRTATLMRHDRERALHLCGHQVVSEVD